MRLSPWFILVTLFWVGMNGLLWRNEFGGGRAGGTPVSPDLVLERLLTAPDSSTLEVQYQGRDIGFVHWYPDPGEETPAESNPPHAYVPEGMVRVARDYKVRLDGQFQGETAFGKRLQFHLELTLDTNRLWRTFGLQMGARPNQVAIRAEAETRTLDWTWNREGVELRQSVSFDQLKDPASLLPGGAAGLGMLLAGPLRELGDPTQIGTDLSWESRLDWAPFGSSTLRVYRVRLLSRERPLGEILMNRAGEILRVELPGGLRLRNDSLGGF